jgi:hypothetical protein
MKSKKSIILIIFIAVCAVALLAVAIIFLKAGGSEISEGTYYVADCSDYPDAYIVVDENLVQFYNIDLNEIYLSAQMETYEKMVESGVEFNFTDGVEEAANLNGMFVTKPYLINYDEADDNKTGTFTYAYFCMGEENAFGLVLEYDAFHKTIKINSPVRELVFEK